MMDKPQVWNVSNGETKPQNITSNKAVVVVGVLGKVRTDARSAILNNILQKDIWKVEHR